MGVDLSTATITSNGSTLTVANGATNWLQVNPNGILTRPQTPLMRGAFLSQGTFYKMGANNVQLSDVRENTGSCWNNSTGTWTCPVAGYYFCQMGGICSGGSNGVTGAGYFGFKKNGTLIHFTHWNHASYWEYGNISAVILCSAGDTITFYLVSNSDNSGNGGFYAGGGHGIFSIGLIA